MTNLSFANPGSSKATTLVPFVIVAVLLAVMPEVCSRASKRHHFSEHRDAGYASYAAVDRNREREHQYCGHLAGQRSKWRQFDGGLGLNHRSGDGE